MHCHRLKIGNMSPKITPFVLHRGGGGDINNDMQVWYEEWWNEDFF